jgi:hypothetical protein
MVSYQLLTISYTIKKWLNNGDEYAKRRNFDTRRDHGKLQVQRRLPSLSL